MIEQTAKVLIGTAFYVGILWVAQRNPRAAGMMLTFPTLNGIVLLMAEPAALEAAASAMLLMPPLNAVLCASYLAGFDRLTRPGLTRRAFAPATVSGLLAVAVAAVWLLFAVAIAFERCGVPPELQALYATVAVAVGVGLTWGLPPRKPEPLATQAKPQPLGTLLARNRSRIAVFAMTLAAVAIVDRLGGSPEMLGALAGLPLVALFGLHSIASDDLAPIDARRDALAGMASSVWLGPGIAILFVATLWRALALHAETSTGIDHLLIGAVLLLAGWSLSILAIWGLTRLMPSAPRVSRS